jgi:hypothetical protein
MKQNKTWGSAQKIASRAHSLQVYKEVFNKTKLDGQYWTMAGNCTMTTQQEGILEVDHDRGVIYFHNRKTGFTSLRICRLGTIQENFSQIDITHMHGVQVTGDEDMPVVLDPPKEVWVIHCQTGCSCCHDDNFTQGPYLTEEAAIEVQLQYEAGHGNPLASQYAKHGVYSVEKWEIEVLSDGRWIHENQVFKAGFEVRELLDYHNSILDRE